MISVRTYDDAGVREVADPADISELIGNGALVWVDLFEAEPHDFECVAREFDLHALAMEDAQKHGQRPKLEHYPTHAFIVAYTADLAEVDVFVGRDWVVTVRARAESGAHLSLDHVRARFELTRSEGTNVGILLYTILDVIVDGYFEAVERTDEQLEAVEDRIFGGDVGSERDVQSEIFAIRRQLLLFRRAVSPLREVVAALLRHEVAWIDGAATVHLQDVFDHVLRAIDRVDLQRDLMGNAVDAHLALISNRMNMVMKKMTSGGAIVLGATLIAGIYGMNFEHMPELGWRYGYLWALGLMGALTGLLWWYFRRKDWL